jgi:hypothetical protein
MVLLADERSHWNQQNYCKDVVVRRAMKLEILFAVLISGVSMTAQSPPSIQSRVAGRFVAYNYGQWSIPVYGAPNGTGSKTFTVSNATAQLTDFRQIMPFNTNAQVYVGTELVTISNVGAGCIQGNISAGACVLTATFSNTHQTGEPIRSGTFGLQEALNDAGSVGGGAVTIDQAWVGIGGTSAIKNAATLPSNTAIEDARTGLPAPSGGPYLPLAGGALTGPLYTATEYSNGTCTTTATIAPLNGNRQKITLTNGNTCALTFTQPSSGTVSITLKVVQSSTSTFNGGISGCKWPGGTVPTITATSAAVDFVSIYLDGTNAYCVASQNFQ